MSNLSRSELIQQAAEKAGTTQATADKVLKAFLESISGAMAEKKKVTLVGFGTFSTTERAARTGRNPQTGKEMKIAASTAVKFKAGKSLQEAVNK